MTLDKTGICKPELSESIPPKHAIHDGNTEHEGQG